MFSHLVLSSLHLLHQLSLLRDLSIPSFLLSLCCSFPNCITKTQSATVVSLSPCFFTKPPCNIQMPRERKWRITYSFYRSWNIALTCRQNHRTPAVFQSCSPSSASAAPGCTSGTIPLPWVLPSTRVLDHRCRGYRHYRTRMFVNWGSLIGRFRETYPNNIFAYNAHGVPRGLGGILTNECLGWIDALQSSWKRTPGRGEWMWYYFLSCSAAPLLISNRKGREIDDDINYGCAIRPMKKKIGGLEWLCWGLLWRMSEMPEKSVTSSRVHWLRSCLTPGGTRLQWDPNKPGLVLLPVGSFELRRFAWPSSWFSLLMQC